MATIINLNDGNPPAPANASNIKWQAVPPPADPSIPRDVSAYVPHASTTEHGTVQLDGNAGHALLGDGTWGEAAAGASDFLGLTDSPDSYSGQGGKVVKVKSTADGLEFGDVATPPATFTDLTDTPDVYTGAAGKAVAVKGDQSGLEFVSMPQPVSTFEGLSDVPAYAGSAGKAVFVTQAENGVEFKSPPGSFYEIVLFYQGKPTSGELLFRMKMARAVTFPAGLTTSKTNAGVAPLADYVIVFKKAGVQFATLTFATGQTTGTFTLASPYAFAENDIFEIYAPNSLDANFQDIALTLVLTI